jgi:hypothetical protein
MVLKIGLCGCLNHEATFRDFLILAALFIK